MERLQVTVKKRQENGKQAAKKLRDGGFIPAVIYGKDFNNAISIPSDGFKLLRDIHFSESTVIDLTIEGSKESDSIPVLVKDVQYHPLTDKVIHIDLLKVSLKKKITVHIPLVLKGEAQGKEEGAVLEQILREVEVEGFPLNIPENIEVDISGLEIGHSLHVENIPSPEGVEIVTEPTATIATLVVKKEEEPEEEELAEEAPGEPEVIKEKKEEAGEEKEGQQAEGKPEKESGKKEGQGEK
ncbi:MAG: 50S ribosomal protein L25 [Candidatus Omnitrophica bacterium]|nr:50S ribosomal protein L25 [Candidatus Omnitrophota bacterium]MCF7891765.1 50S ribosomal protein L25 [Candidatus Omnitrophota bacterium]MCF7897234.1 50S ribosomal protein L25 [Candidatus Omnitrophota bacterium]MCF7909422.1 50S ribosomal protein L25 [Candidatus Omnitrophota bacterium]